MHDATKFVRRQELMRLLLAGHMLKECAKHLGMHYYTVRKYAREPEFLAELRSYSKEIYERVDAELKATKDDITERLEQASDTALDTIIQMMTTSSSDAIKLKAAQDILDRDGRASRTSRVESEQTRTVHITREDLTRFVTAADEIDRSENPRG